QDIMASQPLGATQVADLLLLRQQGDERFWRMGLKLGAGGLFQTTDMACKLNRRHLEPETQSQIRYLPFAGVLNTANHALCATQSVTPRDDNAVYTIQAFVHRVDSLFQVRSIYKLQVSMVIHN